MLTTILLFWTNHVRYRWVIYVISFLDFLISVINDFLLFISFMFLYLTSFMREVNNRKNEQSQFLFLETFLSIFIIISFDPGFWFVLFSFQIFNLNKTFFFLLSTVPNYCSERWQWITSRVLKPLLYCPFFHWHYVWLSIINGLVFYWMVCYIWNDYRFSIIIFSVFKMSGYYQCYRSG
jgi:hypothetical protein